ncbi:hypothetical protein EGI32_15900 [Ferruginibacter sp. HRS2-29]|nr:hypothetical protein [Ferruginibacter sp. HRS2-29]
MGNVLVTISDKKFGVDDGTYDPATGVKTNGTPDSKIDFYTADVVTANDYYPFGMLMPGRKFAGDSKYRNGFNGKEKDNEVKGDGNQQDYGMRIYDPRIGKFLSVDPIASYYPMLTPYQFASNRPIDGIDLDGQEWWKPIVYAIFPVGGLATDKEIQKGFSQRAIKTIHGLKDLPKSLQKMAESLGGTVGTPGPAFVKAQEEKRAALMKAFGKASVEDLKEIGNLVREAVTGNKQAMGALTFEILLLMTPGGEEINGALKGLKYASKFGKCVEYATQFSKTIEPLFLKAGATVERFDINIGKDGLIGTATQQLSDNGFHSITVVTLKDNTELIFDNFHNGVLKSDYIKEVAGMTREGKMVSGAELLSSAKKVVPKTKKK